MSTEDHSSWSLTQHLLQLPNNHFLYEKMDKYVAQFMIFIDYVPLVGPLYNAVHALNLMLMFWCAGNGNNNSDETVDHQERRERQQTSRRIREKGLTAVVTALIDIFTVCLGVGVIAFLCDCLTRIQTFAFARQLLITFVMVNMLALTIGAKIITGQGVLYVTRQLEDVTHVSTSMVKSVSITTMAIERFVETAESTTDVCVRTWQRTIEWIYLVVTFPHRKVVEVRHRVRVTTKRVWIHTTTEVRRRITVHRLANLFTLGMWGFFQERMLRYSKLQ